MRKRVNDGYKEGGVGHGSPDLFAQYGSIQVERLVPADGSPMRNLLEVRRYEHRAVRYRGLCDKVLVMSGPLYVGLWCRFADTLFKR